MKKSISLLAILFLVAGISISRAEVEKTTEKPWFDLKSCVFCKPIADQPGLLEHMYAEYHNISNGLVSVLLIDTAYNGAFMNALKGMAPGIKALKEGKNPTVCPHCETMGVIEANPKVKTDFIQTDFGYLTIYTSSDSASVAQLQAFGKRTAEEGKTRWR